MYGVQVLVLPGHCTHVLQLFDVGLAAPLKLRFTIIFTNCLKAKSNFAENTLHTLSTAQVQSPRCGGNNFSKVFGYRPKRI